MAHYVTGVAVIRHRATSPAPSRRAPARRAQTARLVAESSTLAAAYAISALPTARPAPSSAGAATPAATASARTITLADVQTSKTCNARFARVFQVAASAPAAGGTRGRQLVRHQRQPRPQRRACSVRRGLVGTHDVPAPRRVFRFTGWKRRRQLHRAAEPRSTLKGVTSNLELHRQLRRALHRHQRRYARERGLHRSPPLLAAGSYRNVARCTVDAQFRDHAVRARHAQRRRRLSVPAAGADGADSMSDLVCEPALRATKTGTASLSASPIMVAATASAGGSVLGHCRAAPPAPTRRCTVADRRRRQLQRDQRGRLHVRLAQTGRVTSPSRPSPS